MAKPVNAMTGDAPDGQNPDKKYVPEKTGRFKYTPPPPPKPDPRDAEIFTEEKLRRSGGKMKEPPMGLDSKKHGGSIKARRYSPGGEIMDEYNGAMGRGTDTPDKKIAREKSDAAYASDASDKAAGLKGSKGEDVGFFKRLMMGNIDKPGSEAYEKFGAGRGRADAAREDANKSARNERENARTREANMALDENTPAPVKTKPSVDNNPIATGYTNRLEKEERNAETELTSAERANAMRPNRVAATVKPTVTKPTPVKRPVQDPTAGEGKEGAAAQLAADKQGDAAPAASNRGNSFEVPAAPKVKTETDGLPTLDTNAPTPKSTGYQGGPNALEKIIQGIPGGGASLAGIAALGTAAGVGGAKLYKMYKAAQAAKRAKEAAYRPEPNVLTGKDYSGEAQAAADAFRKKAGFKRGGTTKAYAKGGSVSGRSSVSASSRGDGCAQRGKTRGTMR